MRGREEHHGIEGMLREGNKGRDQGDLGRIRYRKTERYSTRVLCPDQHG